MQDKNKAGEVREHLGLFSCDEGRKPIVLRRFHIEGFTPVGRRQLELKAVSERGLCRRFTGKHRWIATVHPCES